MVGNRRQEKLRNFYNSANRWGLQRPMMWDLSWDLHNSYSSYLMLGHDLALRSVFSHIVISIWPWRIFQPNPEILIFLKISTFEAAAILDFQVNWIWHVQTCSKSSVCTKFGSNIPFSFREWLLFRHSYDDVMIINSARLWWIFQLNLVQISSSTMKTSILQNSRWPPPIIFDLLEALWDHHKGSWLVFQVKILSW